MDRAVPRHSVDAEQLGHLRGGARALGVELQQVTGLDLGQLRLLPAQPTFGLATFSPSRAHMLVRSAPNSATIANTLNNNRPIGSVGSWVDPPRLSRTFCRVSSSRLSRASGSDLASRSSLVTTKVSPLWQAARASRRPGLSRLMPVRPWSTSIRSSPTPGGELVALRGQILLFRGHPRIAHQELVHRPGLPARRAPRQHRLHERLLLRGRDGN
jgi:hypothetical protein